MPVPAAWRALILKWAMRRSLSAERSTLDRLWMTETGIQTEFDYCWTAYQVYQMEDGTVYLDGSGNSYGGMGGFTTKVTDTQTKTAMGRRKYSLLRRK